MTDNKELPEYYIELTKHQWLEMFDEDYKNETNRIRRDWYLFANYPKDFTYRDYVSQTDNGGQLCVKDGKVFLKDVNDKYVELTRVKVRNKYIWTEFPDLIINKK